jgi:hypothetical protein
VPWKFPPSLSRVHSWKLKQWYEKQFRLLVEREEFHAKREEEFQKKIHRKCYQNKEREQKDEAKNGIVKTNRENKHWKVVAQSECAAAATQSRYNKA